MTHHEPDYIVLHGHQSTLILELVDQGAPVWRYWGTRLPEAALPPTAISVVRPTPSFSLDADVPLTILPTFGNGWFEAPGLLAHREGRDFAQGFSNCEVVWRKPKAAVTLRLIDDVAHLVVEIDLDLDAQSDVVTIKTRLFNQGADALDVQWLAAACLPLPASAARVRSFTGRHNHEFIQVDDQLTATTWLRENRRGLTSHDCVPAAVVASAATNQETGPAFGAQLAWSGNHCQRIDQIGSGTFVWQLGEWLAPGEVRLGRGESLTTPEVLATYSSDGFGGVARNFHAAIRARMNWPGGTMKPRPVHFNTWEGVYFDLKEDALFDMASRAADLGIERFVLDDGWFHGRRSDQAGLGDWWVDTAIFPNGLGPLAQHVTGLGMEFGLWVEPEMINPDSDLYRAHPDWALQLAGRPMLTARNQLVLDLTKPEVTDYLLGHLGKLLDSLPISYLKWDHNRDLTTAGSAGFAAYRRQTLAGYALFDAIRTRWSDVEIEACAGGGGRIDAGILTRTQRVWTSDCIDAVSRVAIQRGFLQFFPPEIMGCHIGASPAHATGRSQSMSFRGAVALCGHYGVELDPRHLSAGDQMRVRQWIDLYKANREVLHQGLVWQGEAGDGLTWVAQGGRDDFILTVIRCAPTGQRWPMVLPLSFVDSAKTYRAKIVHLPNQIGPHDGPGLAEIFDGSRPVHGAWLKEAGLPLPALPGESVLILRLKAQD
jgi:alpha-galactosidase